MLQFLSPYLALGLLGILLPLALHWWNKRQQKPILVGSIRFLEQSVERRIRSMQFKDFWLFLLRSLLLVLFTVLLMQPVVLTQEEQAIQRLSKWVIIEPEIYKSGHLQARLDSLHEVGYEIRLLENNFPEIARDSVDKFTQGGGGQITMTLFSRLKSIEKWENRPDTVLLYAYPTTMSLKGNLPNLNYVLQWPSLPGESETIFLAKATIEGEYISFTIGQSDEDELVFFDLKQSFNGESEFNFEGVPTIFLQEGKAYLTAREANQVLVGKGKNLQAHIVAATKYKEQRKILRAALATIESYQKTKIEVKEYQVYPKAGLPAKADVVFWLEDGKVPFSTDATTKWIQLANADFQEMPIEHAAQNNLYFLQPNLDPSRGDLRAARLPAALMELLFGGDISKQDARRFPQGAKLLEKASQVKPPRRESASPGQSKQPVALTSLHFTFWLLLIALFALERFAAQTIKSP